MVQKKVLNKYQHLSQQVRERLREQTIIFVNSGIRMVGFGFLHDQTIATAAPQPIIVAFLSDLEIISSVKTWHVELDMHLKNMGSMKCINMGNDGPFYENKDLKLDIKVGNLIFYVKHQSLYKLLSIVRKKSQSQGGSSKPMSLVNMFEQFDEQSKTEQEAPLEEVMKA